MPQRKVTAIPSPIAPAAKKCYYNIYILSYIKRGEIE